ncbi:TrkH family potassium uptake protein [Pseudidiomarina andamanensis]|uniref:Trk system potassium uptake protein n=1 Tax=Pseudidiomarina andamanensis TaxID=1940690 RepID=A0AA92IL45_9GAMM|nr:potassium transporter TrkG [Pseudidiomarina andamanensis]MDS0218200.1 potassium transporter [Pseudidiomarina andamanensis]QGT95086.1 potassium transporter [Pseudidiomarina andamanensis]
MRLKILLKLLSIPLAWVGFVQFIFAWLNVFYFRDGTGAHFFFSSALVFLVAISFWAFSRNVPLTKIYPQDGLLFATFTWLLAGLCSAIPIYLVTDVSWTDATFESISAMTTTGATILVGLDDMPIGFLMYRQFLQWLGGLGVVIFVVAVLPMLNVGGMRLLVAETPGPVKDEKIVPRVGYATRYLWLIYVSITTFCALSYWLAGMSAYDAIAHSFTTVSTGGFSTHDASMGYFDSQLILYIANVFMILGAISFNLHYRVIFKNQWNQYWQDEETRVFIHLIAAISIILIIILTISANYDTLSERVAQSIFHIVSFMTSTGYGATDLSAWPVATGLLLVFTSYLGGCAGSTAGGNKIVRDIITFKIIRQQLFLLSHPHAVKAVRYQKQLVGSDVLSAVMAFMLLAATMSLVLTIALMATGLDFWSSFTAVSACLNVLGPGFGEVGSNFIPVTDAGIWILNFAMLLGRLEYFTIIALLLPSFWQR